MSVRLCRVLLTVLWHRVLLRQPQHSFVEIFLLGMLLRQIEPGVGAAIAHLEANPPSEPTPRTAAVLRYWRVIGTACNIVKFVAPFRAIVGL